MGQKQRGPPHPVEAARAGVLHERDKLVVVELAVAVVVKEHKDKVHKRGRQVDLGRQLGGADKVLCRITRDERRKSIERKKKATNSR